VREFGSGTTVGVSKIVLALWVRALPEGRPKRERRLLPCELGAAIPIHGKKLGGRVSRAVA